MVFITIYVMLSLKKKMDTKITNKFHMMLAPDWDKVFIL